MKKILMSVMVLGLFAAAAPAAQASTFDRVLEHYEPVRLALLGDSLDGVAEHGRAIAAELESLAADFSAERAGASAEVAPVVRDTLPEMLAAAKTLASATSLEPARDAFYELTKPLVRWREGVPAGNGRPAVGYCPMYKRSWLQPGAEIGNPYGGMPRCGSIVAK